MFYVLVKFVGEQTPVLFGTTNVMDASRLATMASVEWASPTISGNGYALSYKTDLGGEHVDEGLGERIAPYACPPF